MNDFTLTLVVTGFIALLVLGAVLADIAGPNPLVVGDRRFQAIEVGSLQRHHRRVAGGAFAMIAVLFVVVATFPQGGPRP